MRKPFVALCLFLAVVFCAVTYLWGYNHGISHAMTAEGYRDGDEFILVVDDNEYVWGWWPED